MINPTQALSAVAMLLALASPQAPTSSPRFPPRPPPRPEPKMRPTLSPAAKKEVARMREELQGVWRLEELWDPRIRPSDKVLDALVLVQGDHLSMEVHIDFLDERRFVAARLFDSGVYHYELLEGSRIEMRSLLSAVLDPNVLDTRLHFRPPGYARRYKLEFAAEKMIWTREDGQRSEFRRLAGTGPPRDIFGRKIPPQEEPDAEGEEGGGAPAGAPKAAPGAGETPR